MSILRKFGKLIGGIFIAFWVIMLGIYVSPIWYFGLLAVFLMSGKGQLVSIAAIVLYGMVA